MRITIFSLIILCATFLADNCVAASSYRVCQTEDLKGLYRLSSFKEVPARKEARWHSRIKYHYLQFMGTDGYVTLASTQPYTVKKEIAERLNEEYEKHQTFHSLSADGTLNFMDGKSIEYSFRCFKILNDRSGYIPGDIVLTGYSRAKTEIFETYRLW